MKVLFTTPILEHPAAGGPQLRIENSIKALSNVCELDICHRAYAPSNQVANTDAYFSKFARNYITYFDQSPQHNRIARLFKRIFGRLLHQQNPKYLRELVRYIMVNDIDVVWFGYGNISFPLIMTLKKRLPNIKVVCDTDSVWSRFILRELPYAEGPRRQQIQIDGKKKQNEEEEWVELCEVTTAVSEVDAAYYRSIASHPERIYLFSNVIDVTSYKIVPARPEGFVNPCIFLAGSYGPNSAMNMAAKWVLDEVLPILYESYSNIHFYIVGRNSDSQFGDRAGPGITVTGTLDSVLPFLCHSNVALVPLKFESGTRFKILEAAACNVPIVSTTLGAEGIPVIDGEHLLIADTADEFASAIRRILDDQVFAKFLSDNCFKLVTENNSIEALSIEAVQILELLENA
ncbi:glycosyltransferase [Cyanobium sp. BA5m-21]|uniref:glycosyltransferase n=1 Tax=unclassified Cyanobium TaxID=2627006 RepID=UPI0020CE2C19|nr:MULTISPECIES: glycosyltransferase [unclassified Cyanobium]MCP9903229.1 glycosyltransferase [Cyanobium sp. BA5m-10]MCP9908028.1 glycosyltransferase [Cyanobium sp. BA5m-21]